MKKLICRQNQKILRFIYFEAPKGAPPIQLEKKETAAQIAAKKLDKMDISQAVDILKDPKKFQAFIEEPPRIRHHGDTAWIDTVVAKISNDKGKLKDVADARLKSDKIAYVNDGVLKAVLECMDQPDEICKKILSDKNIQAGYELKLTALEGMKMPESMVFKVAQIKAALSELSSAPNPGFSNADNPSMAYRAAKKSIRSIRDPKVLAELFAFADKIPLRKEAYDKTANLHGTTIAEEKKSLKELIDDQTKR